MVTFKLKGRNFPQDASLWYAGWVPQDPHESWPPEGGARWIGLGQSYTFIVPAMRRGYLYVLCLDAQGVYIPPPQGGDAWRIWMTPGVDLLEGKTYVLDYQADLPAQVYSPIGVVSEVRSIALPLAIGLGGLALLGIVAVSRR